MPATRIRQSRWFRSCGNGVHTPYGLDGEVHCLGGSAGGSGRAEVEDLNPQGAKNPIGNSRTFAATCVAGKTTQFPLFFPCRQPARRSHDSAGVGSSHRGNGADDGISSNCPERPGPRDGSAMERR